MSLIDALIRNATVLKSPISGTFELTARCNFSCKMCYIHNMSCDKSLRSKELSTEQWIEIAEQAKNQGTLVLLLTGGEPTLRADFCKIYRACAERGFLLSVNTNASLLSEEIFDLFREHPPLRVNASLYGMSEEVYQNLCGNGAAFHNVIRNLERLHAMGIGIRINFTATPFNHTEIDKVYRFANQIGAFVQHTAYMFPPMRTAHPCEQMSRFTPREAAEAMVHYLRVCRSGDDFAAFCREKASEPPARIDECGEISDSVRCRAARASYWITYDGKMLPCGMIPTIFEPVLPNGFADAWSKIVEDFSAIKMPHGCLTCPEYERCDVCPAICLAECGDISGTPHYICQKNSAYRTLLAQFAQKAEGSSCT